MNMGYQQAAYYDHGQNNRIRKVGTGNVHQDVQNPIAGVEHVDIPHSTANNIAEYYAVRNLNETY